MLVSSKAEVIMLFSDAESVVPYETSGASVVITDATVLTGQENTGTVLDVPVTFEDRARLVDTDD